MPGIPLLKYLALDVLMNYGTERICSAVLLPVCSVAASPPLWSQTDAVASKVKLPDASAYEVVSIKPDKSDQSGSSMYSLPDGFRWTNFPVVSLVRAAYGISMDNQIEGLPGWANSDPYDFEVKADEKTTETWKSLSYKERYKKEEPMMQSLLADRCQFKGHFVMPAALPGRRFTRSHCVRPSCGHLPG